MRTAELPILTWLLLVSLCAAPGCRRPDRSGPSSARPGNVAELKSKVIAQGQILPSGGFIRLAAKPGDVVDEVLVASGEHVNSNTPLLRMRSEAINATQLAVFDTRLREAKRNQAVAIQTATQQVAAVQIKLEHMDAQGKSLDRQTELLELAKKQVAASQRVLKQLQDISNDAITGEFVGQLEIDRQQIALRDAELAYRQKQDAHQRATEDLHFAKRAATAELQVAKSAQAAATESEAIRVVELEIESLKQQMAASIVAAPTDGTVVAVNVRPGEAAGAYPLVELANTQSLVCEVEVNEMDAAAIEVDQPAKMFSRAFGTEPLLGRVIRKSALIGRPQLRPQDPLARVDFRAVTAIIELDAASTEKARQWLQLQVEVEIDISN